MAFNYNKLRGKIIEKFGTQSAFSKAMRVSERTLSLKLNGRIYFVQDEIALVAELLGIPQEEIQVYFFTPKVQQSWTKLKKPKRVEKRKENSVMEILERRKELHEIEKQINYIVQENLELEELYRKGIEANGKLVKNRLRLTGLMEEFTDEKI